MKDLREKMNEIDKMQEAVRRVKSEMENYVANAETMRILILDIRENPTVSNGYIVLYKHRYTIGGLVEPIKVDVYYTGLIDPSSDIIGYVKQFHANLPAAQEDFAGRTGQFFD